MNKGFQLKCLNCGFEYNIKNKLDIINLDGIHYEVSFDTEEDEYVITCKNCGNSTEVKD